MDSLVVRLKAIKYLEDFFCYLSSQTILSGRSFQAQPSYLQTYPQVLLNGLRHQASPKFWIQDPSKQQNRASSSPNLSAVISNSECSKATSVLTTSLIVELNRHQGAVLCCVQRAVHFRPRHGGFLGPGTYVSKRSYVLPTQAPSQASSVLQAFISRKTSPNPNGSG